MAIPILAFVATASLWFALLMLFVRGGKNRDQDVLTSRGRRPLVFGRLTEALAAVLPGSKPTRERLSRFLRHAGHYHRLALAEFLALRNALVVGTALVTLAAIVVATEPGDALMFQLGLAGLIAGALFYSVPRLLLEMAANNRVRRIEESLPDALDMITMCMSGGLPLQSAVTRVSEEIEATHPDLAFELRVVGRQMDAGSLDYAMKQFAQRIDAPEIHSLASIVWQTEQQGSGVATAFEGFADNVRLNRRQRAEEAGNKTAVKMLFPLVFCLAPPVYLMLLTPAVIEIGDFLRRENEPGGALGASAENMRPLLADTPSTAGVGATGGGVAGPPAAQPAGAPAGGGGNPQ